MCYFQIGLIIGIVSTLNFVRLTLKNRWFNDNALEDLYLWWDGQDYEPDGMFAGIIVSIGALILAPLVITLLWVILLPLLLIFLIILIIRRRNINKNKQ
jgi:hypothetical protein|tara:strand:+ start:1854 stop:2150 length:297 start_codon:yes stop_codon:yes gene_type:complete